MKHISIATRGSRLALWQAEHVKTLLEARYGDMEVELLVLKTRGDIILDVPLSKVGGKGLFVKEIEEALLDGRADLAVHSMKDVPMLLPEGLCLGVIPHRGPIADMYLSEKYADLFHLPPGSLVGTSSLRRQAQVLHLRPDLRVSSLRGNVDTRLRKLREGHFDAIIMASAGVNRLGLECTYSVPLEESRFYPACGQGALGIEYRSDRPELADMLSFMEDSASRARVEAERSFMAALDGGCQAPIAAWTILDAEGQLTLFGLVADIDGQTVITQRATAPMQDAILLGRITAQSILDAGGKAILEQLYPNGKVV